MKKSCGVLESISNGTPRCPAFFVPKKGVMIWQKSKVRKRHGKKL